MSSLKFLRFEKQLWHFFSIFSAKLLKPNLFQRDDKLSNFNNISAKSFRFIKQKTFWVLFDINILYNKGF